MRYGIIALLCACATTGAQAHVRHHHHHARVAHHHYRRHSDDVKVAGESRPADCHGIPWCGCFMRHLEGVKDESYNLAREWVHFGHATTAHVGAIVVWPHHVGKIVGESHGEFIVLSGNDGHRVRERARSVRGAIAFREP